MLSETQLIDKLQQSDVFSRAYIVAMVCLRWRVTFAAAGMLAFAP